MVQYAITVESIGPVERTREGSSDRVGFEITFWIAPANRVEFLQTAISLLSVPGDRALCSRSCFERVGAENMFLWRESWGTRAAVDERLESVPLRALLGAIEVLGRMEEMKMLEFFDWAERSRG
jgi:hypothetical protein